MVCGLHAGLWRRSVSSVNTVIIDCRLKNTAQTMETQPRILLVDDDEAIIVTLTTVLKLSGVAVEAATSGEQALELLAQASPALIVMDVLMPGMDGRATLRHLRRQGSWTPVILLTRISGTAERIMALEEGAD